MRARSSALLVGIPLVGGILACGGGGPRPGDFSGTVEVRNVTVDEIWVDRVQGLDAEPPVGRLTPGGLARAELHPMHLPDELRLKWYPAGHPEQMRLTAVNLTALRPTPRSELRLVFGDQGWTVELGP